MFERIEEKLVKERSGIVFTPVDLPHHMGYVISRIFATNPFVYGPRIFNGLRSELLNARDICLAIRQMLTVERSQKYARINNIEEAAGKNGSPDANVVFKVDPASPSIVPGNLVAMRRFYIFGRKQGDVLPLLGAAHRTRVAMSSVAPWPFKIMNGAQLSRSEDVERCLDLYAMLTAFAPASGHRVAADGIGTWPGLNKGIPVDAKGLGGPAFIHAGPEAPIGEKEVTSGVGVRVAEVNASVGSALFASICNLAGPPHVDEKQGIVGGTAGSWNHLWMDVLGVLTWWLESPKTVGSFGPVIQDVFTDDERKRFTKIEQLEKEAERVAYANLVFGLVGPLVMCHILHHHMNVEPIKSFIEMRTSGAIRNQLRSKVEQLTTLPLPRWVFEMLRPLGTQQRSTPWGTLPCVGVDRMFFADTFVADDMTVMPMDGSDITLKSGTVWMNNDEMVTQLKRWVPFINHLHQLFFPVGIQGDKRSFPSVHSLVSKHLGWITRGGDSIRPLKFELFNDRVIESDTLSFSATVDDLDDLAMAHVASPKDGYSHDYNVRVMSVDESAPNAVKKVRSVAYRTNQHGMSQPEIVGDVNPLDWVPFTELPVLLERSEAVELNPDSFARLAGITAEELAERVEDNPSLWAHLFTVVSRSTETTMARIEVTPALDEKGQLVKPTYAVTSKELVFFNNNCHLITPDLRVARAILIQGDLAMDDVRAPRVKLISSLLLPSAVVSAETVSARDQDLLGLGNAIQP